jgi:hypothetical protein
VIELLALVALPVSLIVVTGNALLLAIALLIDAHR